MEQHSPLSQMFFKKTCLYEKFIHFKAILGHYCPSLVLSSNRRSPNITIRVKEAVSKRKQEIMINNTSFSFVFTTSCINRSGLKKKFVPDITYLSLYIGGIGVTFKPLQTH